LLQLLQGLEIKSRAKTISQDSLEHEVVSVNEFLIMNRLALTEEDGLLAHVYLNAVTEIHKVVSEAPSYTRESWDWTWDVFDDDGVVSHYFRQLSRASDYLQKELLKCWEGSEG